MFERMKRWYRLGLWSKPQVQDAVDKTIITPDQYDEIVGEE